MMVPETNTASPDQTFLCVSSAKPLCPDAVLSTGGKKPQRENRGLRRGTPRRISCHADNVSIVSEKELA